ncbi:hypothetical protein DACRYDRAFT_21553 [Dacryopinax primogenitus]|uniref:Secreted protein n=1 Tax=Dacryopinax primogenitus (strain DJM 731) TaxID=1858805 RepID=M5FZ88_DACPD|nr:uncharacterized protein DACRYDRAFT_21553 [Dacryopinax primogenitus]EJU03361.1 hypothetical protein DACRYDRAFT_21553 [Dacryopinax primogenitus]
MEHEVLGMRLMLSCPVLSCLTHSTTPESTNTTPRHANRPRSVTSPSNSGSQVSNSKSNSKRKVEHPRQTRPAFK